jgi:hypothetical protein
MTTPLINIAATLLAYTELGHQIDERTELQVQGLKRYPCTVRDTVVVIFGHLIEDDEHQAEYYALAMRFREDLIGGVTFKNDDVWRLI